MERKPSNLKEYVVNSILEDIYSSVYAPGDILNEKALIEKYNCSKSPVREALLSLCADGVLKNIPRYGYEVIRLTKEDIFEMLQFRLAIEGGILRERYKNISAEDFAELERLDQLCKINDTDARTHFEYNIGFHIKLVQSCGNMYVTDQLKQCMVRLKRAYAQFYWNPNVDIMFSMDTRHHIEILDNLKKGNIDAALYALRADLSDFGGTTMFFTSGV